MEELRVGRMSMMFGYSSSFLRRCMFSILSKGPIPCHIAFIMDGNRRFAEKENLKSGIGHRAGFSALMCMLKYCCELRVKYITFYAFSIDNFKRRSDEVQTLMDLMVEKAEGLIQQESIVDEYGVRVFFLGNLKLLSEEVQLALEKVMKATTKNTKCMLLICVAYSSSDEIRRAVQQCCIDKSNQTDPNITEKGSNAMTEGQELDVKYSVHESMNHLFNGSLSKNESNDVIPVEKSEKMSHYSSINVVDVEKHMDMAVASDPDILIRTSGETRLSNFLLWQSSSCLLYSPSVLWPEIGLWELVCAILSFQRNRHYLEKKRKQC